jgi:hypothetical protein
VQKVPKLRSDYEKEPSPERLSPQHPRRSEIMSRHGEAVVAGKPTYSDPSSGLSVMTAKFLADRGYCCTSGCRHCPFEQV